MLSLNSYEGVCRIPSWRTISTVTETTVRVTDTLAGREIWWSSNANSCSKCGHHWCWSTSARAVSHWVLKTSGDGHATTTLVNLFPLNKVFFLNAHLEICKPQPVALGLCYYLPLTEEFGFLIFVTTLQVLVGCRLITQWSPLHQTKQAHPPSLSS